MVKKVATPAKKAVAKKAAPVKGAAKKATPAKAAPAKKATAKAAATRPAAAKPAAKKTSPRTAVAKTAGQTSKDAVKPEPTLAKAAKTTRSRSAAKAETVEVAATPATTRRTGPPKKAPVVVEPDATLPPVKGETKDGIKFTKDFDAKFLAAQRKLLIDARVSLTGQAVRLEDEANSLIDDEMGDVQFDDESGEGDTMVVERERDLFLSARARADIELIDSALQRLEIGTYGYSVISFRPIPRERLEAIPWATELTEEKIGGIGRR